MAKEKKKKFCGAWAYALLHIESTFYNHTPGGGKSFILNGNVRISISSES